MTIKSILLSLSLLFGIVSVPTQLMADDRPQTNNQKQVEAAAAQFYVALNALFKGEVEPMLEVWSHDDDITYMGPGGGLHFGWEQIRSDWEHAASLKLGGKIEASDIHIFTGEQLAIVQNHEIGKNIDDQGNTIQVKIRATNIFRLQDGQWLMISHHTDLLPYLEE